MTRSASRCRGLSMMDGTVIGMIALITVVLLLPMLGHLRRENRGMQNSTQLRGIHQGMFTYAQSSKPGGPMGWYPGFNGLTGETILVSDEIQAAQLAATHPVPGYAAMRSQNVLPGEMNAGPHRGFIVRAFAELASGDFIPMGSADFFIHPADRVKTPFIAGDPGPAGRFGANNISYTTLNVSANDADLFPLKAEWRESNNPDAILLADRAIGDGSDPATRSSVWTEFGSGDWRGSVLRNDGSTSFEASPDGTGMGLRYGERAFENGDTLNLFSHTFRLTASDEISADSGVLYDEADSGSDPDAF